MDQRAKDLVAIGDALFSQRRPLLSLWQAIAENFYPERADFTSTFSEGEEFASGLMTSFPAIMRRELGNLFATFLRPRATPWFRLKAGNERLDKDNQARAWLEYASGVQWRAMYDPAAQFVRATKEGDHDFATFGQCVISGELNSDRDALLYRSYHLRDNAWTENQNGKIDTNHLKWELSARQLVKMFPKSVDAKVKDCAEKEPNKKIKCRRVVLPAAEYDMKQRRRLPFVSVYLDEENETMLEEAPLAFFPFVIPRWQTISGSQYARSMATEIALPDSRTLQTMTDTLLEAGEKVVDPPMIATQEAIRSDMGLYAGGVTWIDREYDERNGDPLRPLTIDGRMVPLGIEMSNMIREDIRQGFFLNKLTLPLMDGRQRTAYEVQKILEDHIRSNAPLFEPIEDQYNAPLCDLTFELLRANGAFGPVDMVPESLRGADVSFNFDSPLREVADEAKGQMFLQGLGLVKAAAEVDGAQVANVRMTAALRDSLQGLRWPAEWLEDASAVDSMRKTMAEKQQAADTAAMLDAGTKIAGQAGVAGQELEAAGLT